MDRSTDDGLEADVSEAYGEIVRQHGVRLDRSGVAGDASLRLTVGSRWMRVIRRRASITQKSGNPKPG